MWVDFAIFYLDLVWFSFQSKKLFHPLLFKFFARGSMKGLSQADVVLSFSFYKIMCSPLFHIFYIFDGDDSFVSGVFAKPCAKQSMGLWLSCSEQSWLFNSGRNQQNLTICLKFDQTFIIVSALVKLREGGGAPLSKLGGERGMWGVLVDKKSNPTPRIQHFVCLFVTNCNIHPGYIGASSYASCTCAKSRKPEVR